MAPETPDRADPLTRLVAERVAELRKAAGLNQAGLGARMAGLRPGWSRSTVVKLENFKRESISAGDLFALAVALDVPPVWLLIDPHRSTPVPIADGVESDPWSALLWMTGKRPLDEPGAEWGLAAVPIEWASRVAILVDAFQEHRRLRGINAAVLPDEHDPREDDEQDRVRLQRLRDPLRRLRDAGFPLPPLPADVRERARELGVDLPKQEG